MNDKQRRQKRFQQKQNKFEQNRRKIKDTWFSPENVDVDLVARKMTNHGKLCSCWMCGNPRKYNQELTLQEQKFELNEKEY